MKALIDFFLSLFDPLSRALVPLVDGFLRKRLLNQGLSEHTVRINGVYLHYYYRPAALPKQRSFSWFGFRRNRRSELPTPLLLIHGLGDNALTWALTEPLLSRKRDIYIVDLPGYGLSGLPAGQPTCTMAVMVEILAGFVREVIKHPVLVAGNSMGGWIALRLAQLEPTWIRKIVLLNAGGAFLEGQPSWDPFLEVVAMHDLKTTRRAIRQIMGFAPAPLLYFIQRSLQDRFQHQVVRSFVAQANERDFLTAEELQAISTPVAIIWGMRDRFLPAGSFEFFRSNLHNPQVRIIRRCGHLPQRERPLAVAIFLNRQANQCDHLNVSGDVLQYGSWLHRMNRAQGELPR